MVKSRTSHLELSEMFGWSAWILELDEGAKEIELESTDMADIGSTVSLDAAGRNESYTG